MGEDSPSPGMKIQMMAKGPEDEDIYGFDSKRDLDTFKASYQRHTHMGTEEASYGLTRGISYYNTTDTHVEIPENKDMFISNMYIHINVERFMRSGTNINMYNIPYYVKNNLGIRSIKRLRVKTSKLTLLDIDSDGLYILLKSFNNDPGFMTMMGNYDIQNPKLITSILSPHLYIPVPLWYAKHHKELFPMCLMKDSLHVHVDFEKGSELIEENPDEDFNIKILLVPNIASGDVKLDITVEYPNTDKYSDYSYEGDYTSPYLAELIVHYVIPTETELKIIKSTNTIEYVVPNVMKIEDTVGLRNRDGNAPGTATLTLKTIRHPVKMFFFVVKNESDGNTVSFDFDAIDTFRINDKEFHPEHLQYVVPYKHDYVSLPRVYSYSFAIDPKSAHPSGHVYFEDDIIIVTTDTEGDEAYSNRRVYTYVMYNNVYRFSNGEMTQVFM
jgi:hypothetical protein